jgi:hypothetical protein
MVGMSQYILKPLFDLLWNEQTATGCLVIDIVLVPDVSHPKPAHVRTAVNGRLSHCKDGDLAGPRPGDVG